MDRRIGTSLHAGLLIAVVGTLAWATGLPALFPSLGPSAFVLATRPDAAASRPQRVNRRARRRRSYRAGGLPRARGSDRRYGLAVALLDRVATTRRERNGRNGADRRRDARNRPPSRAGVCNDAHCRARHPVDARRRGRHRRRRRPLSRRQPHRFRVRVRGRPAASHRSEPIDAQRTCSWRTMDRYGTT